ncbi:MAG: hypothetical protein PGN25_21535 [Methylorubrum populi]
MTIDGPPEIDTSALTAAYGFRAARPPRAAFCRPDRRPPAPQASGAVSRSFGGTATFLVMAPPALAGLALVTLARRVQRAREAGRFGEASRDAV